ncbi:MAG: hypothetical protein GX158_09495 [Bacteroidales bacterium]|nr:hypothetical protein [Bacteroidales bacterium]
MQDKLQEITEKIYREGVSKGNEEAEKIIAEARSESVKMTEKAEEDARQIIAGAERKAGEIIKNAESEIKLSFRLAMNSLKQEIENRIALKIIDEPVSEAFEDDRFLAGLIEIITGKWAQQGDDAGFEIHLPEEQMPDIEKYLREKIHKTLSDKIMLYPDKTTGKGFEIHPSGREYKISVSDDSMAYFLREFIRPRLAELLFGKEK